MLNKYLLLSMIILFAGVFYIPKAEAYSTYNYPSCVNPTGELKASYDSGVHGIAGNTGTFTGSDKVYSLTDSNTLQCFCGDSGEGIQTNWRKVGPDTTSDDIKVLESQGWIYIPDGSQWGLSDDPYLAFNISYACKGQLGGGLSDGRSDGLSDGRSDGRSSNNITTGIGGPEVLGLASTGNMLPILISAFLGLAFISVGLLIKRFER